MQEGTIRELFKPAARGNITLLKTTPSDYQSATVSLLKNAADNDIPVIYVGVKRPYVHLRKLLNDNNIAEDLVYAVDTITKTITDEGVVKRENVEYMDSPQNLTNVATAVSLMAEKINAENAILLIDSIETLMTYNAAHTVSRFLDDLNGRTKTLELSMAILKTGESLEEQIAASLYSIIDDIKIVSGDDEAAYVLEQTDDHTLIELSYDLAQALRWNEGDELDFTITDNNTLKLSKK